VNGLCARFGGLFGARTRHAGKLSLAMRIGDGWFKELRRAEGRRDGCDCRRGDTCECMSGKRQLVRLVHPDAGAVREGASRAHTDRALQDLGILGNFR
jgi:hypothetical protein